MTKDREEKKPLLASGSLKSYGSQPSLTTSQDDSDSSNSSGKRRKTPKKHKTSIFTTFRYSNACDIVLMTLGLFFAIVHGAGFPILSVVFGGMTNTFLRAQVSNFSAPTTLLINTSAAANQTASSHLPAIDESSFIDEVITYSIYYALIGAAIFVASYFQIAFFQSSCERQITRIRHAFFHAVLRQEISWYDKHQSGELTTRLNDDLERIREGIGDKITIFIQNIASFASGFVIGFIYSWKLTLVMMSMTPILALSGAFVGRMMSTATKREQEKYAKAGGIAEEVISCFRTVVALNGQERELERYKNALMEGKKIGYQKYLYSGVGMFVTFFATFASYALAFWYGSELISSDPNFTPGTVFTVFFAVMSGSFALGNAAPHFASIVTAKGAAITIFEIIDTTPHIDPYCVGGLRPEKVSGHIEFRDVGFTYPSRRNVQILGGFSLKVEPGQNIAIVGPSGCGKSTIINLLLRYYDVDRGQVLIDGHNVKHLNVHWLRDKIGLVSQEPVLFDGTIEENIRLGKLDATKDQIIEATKMANAFNFINTLPDGLTTRVGERGVQLSGGQKQRIAIARALIRDPTILLLDEATSALDAESEEIVQEALAKAQKGRTTITIAHRLSTVKDSDWIYVLQQGRLVEEGRHRDLMERHGAYYKMIMAQQLEEPSNGYEAEAEDNTQTGPASSGTDTGLGDHDRSIRSRHSSASPRKLSSQVSEQNAARTGRQRSVQRMDSSPHRSTSHLYSSQVSLSKMQSQDLDRLQNELDEEHLKPTSFKTIYKESRSEWGIMTIGLFGSLLGSVVMPAFALFFSEIVGTYSMQGDALKENSLMWSLMFLLLGFLQGLALLISFYFFGRAGENLTMNLRLKVFKNLLRQDVAYFEDPKHNVGKICTRLASDAPNVRAAMGTRISFLITAVISMIAGIVIAFVFGWKLALVITAMMPVLILSAYLDMRLQMNSHIRDTALLEEAGKTASESIGNIRTVQALCREHYFYTIYINHLKNPAKEALKQAQWYALGFGFAQSVVFFMYAAAFRYGGELILSGDMNSVNVFRVFFAISFCAQSIGQASSFIPDYVKARISAALLMHMMHYEPTIDNCSKAGTKPKDLKGAVSLNKVYFSYPTRSSMLVMQNMTVSVRPGKTLALVGPSGCGKSTVISLIERFYDPASGEINLDNYDLRALNLPHARTNMALVSQEPILFDCSIWDNIAYGLEGKVTHEQVVQAAKLANIHEFVLSLPNGYNTQVGEKGTQLSGGQKQRVAIARALVRNPKILLLDEATSALDTESEKVVQDALDRAREGRTCVMIAHRLSTVQSADVIAVVKDGRIVEKGTHADLIAMKGLYSQMTHMQNLMDDES